ncbi:type II CAAX prenyl endopeptidase Rce1 family protein [Candidatus Altiarchaeota archaeon]
MADKGLILALVLLVLSRTDNGFMNQRAYAFILLVGVSSLYIILSKRGFKDYLIGLGDYRNGIKYSVILLVLALPFMYYGTRLASFREYYPLWDAERDSVGAFLFYEVIVMGALMFYTEFFYRGFLLKSLTGHTRYGNLIQSVIYMYVHLGKPGLEVWWSLPAGYVFGKVDLKCDSILPSFLMHWISSMIFNAMIVYW